MIWYKWNKFIFLKKYVHAQGITCDFEMKKKHKPPTNNHKTHFAVTPQTMFVVLKHTH
jgi:hypothetical protein